MELILGPPFMLRGQLYILAALLTLQTGFLIIWVSTFGLGHNSGTFSALQDVKAKVIIDDRGEDGWIQGYKHETTFEKQLRNSHLHLHKSGLYCNNTK